MGKLIVIEGTDGSGKSTQFRMLTDRLEREKRVFQKLVFPQYAEPSSALIRMYLNGEFGSKPTDVNAYAASAFYSVDRYASYKKVWGKWYEEGGLVISDRYTTSNAVHQASKESGQAQQTFLKWLYEFEYEKLGLPRPDLVVYLDVPTDFTEALLRHREAGDPECRFLLVCGSREFIRQRVEDDAAAMQELEQALANGEKKLVQDDPDKEDGLTPTGEAESYTRTGSILVTDGGSLTEDKLHFSVAENFSQEEEVLQFAPVEENCIRLIRDGKVYSIGIPEKKSLVVSGANAYLSLMNLQLIEIMPLRDGDVLVISGDFLCADEKLAVTIPEAFLLIQGDRSVKESAESNVIQALLPLLTGSGE